MSDIPTPETLERLMRRLPRGVELYDRDPENRTNNMRNLLGAQGRELDLLWDDLLRIMRSRKIENAVTFMEDEFGEDAPNWIFELIVRWVGTVRQSGWSDERLKREFEMDVFLQESWANYEQIKILFAHWFRRRFPESYVRTPRDEVVFGERVGDERFDLNEPHDGPDDRVRETDIFIIDNRRPMQPTSEAPLSYPYFFDGEVHPRYGIFDKLQFIMVPQTAIPKVGTNFFMFQEVDPADRPDGVDDTVHSWGHGLWGITQETVDLEAFLDAVQPFSQAQVHTAIWAYGGFIFQEAPTDANGDKQFNSQDDFVHSWGHAPWDGDVQHFVDQTEKWGSDLWQITPGST